MSVESLLYNTRRLNWLLQHSGSDNIVFNDLCKIMGDILNSNMIIVGKKGKIICRVGNTEFLQDYLDTDINEKFNSIDMTVKDFNSFDNFAQFKYNLVIPISCNDIRQGTIIFFRVNTQYCTEDIILAEYAATFIGLEIMRSENAENAEKHRKTSIVKSAVSTLSYSELEAIIHIFNELNSYEGLIVASKIADKIGITRSVIVNALRKLESAEVIESRSLGMKGTYIKILNSSLVDELKKYKK